MKNLHFITSKTLISLLLHQMLLQQQLVEAQQTIIALQERIDEQTPPTPPDKEVFWHISSGGLTSIDTANSDDITTLRQFYKWNIEFAEKYIRPYVSPKVYSECVNQMTRGLPERIAELQTEVETTSSKEAKTTQHSAMPLALYQPALIH